MRSIKVFAGWMFTLFGIFLFYIDWIGRWEVARGLPKILAGIRAYCEKYPEFGFRAAPWFFMLLGLGIFILLHWPQLLSFYRRLSQSQIDQGVTRSSEKIHENPIDWGQQIKLEFKAISERFAVELGQPRPNGMRRMDGYQAAHENATVIWINNRLYKLPLATDRRVEVVNDAHFNNDPRMAYDDHVSTIIEMPHGKKPPHYGVAVHWQNDPENWKWIGGRIFDCGFKPSAFHVQDFEKGMVVGVFKKSIINNTQGQIFIIFNNGEWRPEATIVAPPECKELGAKPAH